ncbi:acyl-CoA dehydrogenase family protein, partial [Actinocorallia lasiicapitis]
MAIGVTEEHEALAASVRGQAGRGVLSGDLFGLHLGEEHGGQGFGLVELAVAVEELGRARFGGPYVPTVLASAGLAGSGHGKEWLPGLADGSRTAAVGFGTGLTRDGDTVSGTVEIVLGAPADLYVLPAGPAWVVLDAARVTVEEVDSLDQDRPVARVRVEAGAAPLVDLGDFAGLVTVILGAEACGIAARALEDTTGYAVVREQFGRPIGQFQGVKHKAARMLVLVERARAAVWDAARSLDPYAVASAGLLAPDAAVRCAA